MGKPAARIGDTHVCPASTGPVPHVGGPITGPGAPTVFIGKVPAARVGDLAACAGGPPAAITKGAGQVNICGSPAARVGDPTAHGGAIVVGFAMVNIGD